MDKFISAFTNSLNRDKAGAIMLLIFIISMQTEIYWQKMACVGVMIIVFLIRNYGKVKKEVDENKIIK